MSETLCVSCGYIKFGSFVPCQRCGENGSPWVGLGLSTHVFLPGSLAAVGKVVEMIYDKSPTLRIGGMVVAHYLHTLAPDLINVTLPDKDKERALACFRSLQIPQDVRLEKIDFEDTSFGDFLENIPSAVEPTPAEIKVRTRQIRNSLRKWEKEMSAFREERRLRLAHEEGDGGDRSELLNGKP